MFKIEQQYLHTNFITLSTRATIEQLLQALTDKSAAIIELAGEADRAILVMPEERPIIERCFTDHDMDAAEALRDFPYFATICSSSVDLHSELQLQNDRPLVIRADHGDTIIGYRAAS